MQKITKANVEAILDGGNLFVAMRHGNWWQARRNGATQRWKRDASRIAIPFKAGLRSYGKLTETDFRPDLSQFGDSEATGDYLNPEFYRHRDDVPARRK